ncbi:MAG TPA: leucyl/phenylalanyl-tRNA--protein transferase [Tepidisphaeraceae bacterium]|nr:leucyl/phenylalanyl-tRNA--protein transferase [Tepidisphaeraceae bacterium]
MQFPTEGNKILFAMRSVALDPETLLVAYSQGAFPMTDSDGTTRWYTADPRGIIPLETFHVPRSLRQIIRQKRFEIRINHDFERVMRACMQARPEGSWISEQLIAVYTQLHELGYAHSVEAWREGKLAGGLYGVSLGAAFFGESMFHYVRDASKVALVALVERLRERGYELLDTQAATPHLRQFGCIEIRAEDYMRRLKRALARKCSFV